MFFVSNVLLIEIKNIINDRIKDDKYVILNPLLDDLFEHYSYKLNIDAQIFLVPLWHDELVYDNHGFDADLYVWADAGVIRENQPQKNIHWPNLEKINKLDNDKITFFCHHDYVRVENQEFHALSQTRFIQGGSLFVPKNKIEDAVKIFEKVTLNSINNEYVGSDEKMFDFMYLSDPEKYNLIKCGWREYIDLFL